jgi:hypothetical protein
MSLFRETFSEHIIEVRYKPNPLLLDQQGLRAKLLSDGFGYEHWVVSQNVVRAMGSDKKETAFIGYHNAGLVCQDLPDAKAFVLRIETFCKVLYRVPCIEEATLTRLGVRSRFLRAFDASFATLMELFSGRCLRISEPYRKTLAGTIEDVGAPINCRDSVGNFNTHCGPMDAEQAKAFMKREHDLPPVSLYFDIDYWLSPQAKMTEKQVSEQGCAYAQQGWGKWSAVLALMEAP